jgi:hypothetical protein
MSTIIQQSGSSSIRTRRVRRDFRSNNGRRVTAANAIGHEQAIVFSFVKLKDVSGTS